MTDYHAEQLDRHCRVCAAMITGKAPKHTSADIGDVLMKGLGVDVSNDRREIHPPYVCHNCCTKAKQYARSTVKSSLALQQWSPHTETNCTACALFRSSQRGGRPKKSTKNRGRQSLERVSLFDKAPESWRGSEALTPSRFLSPPVLQLCDFQCTLCNNIVDRPVETPCRKLVCVECIPDRYLCQHCSTVHALSTFTSVPPVTLKFLGSLLIQCEKCTEVVELKCLRKHIDSGCSQTGQFSPSQLTIAQLLSRSITSPPTVIEQKAATSVVKRMISSPASSSSQVVRLPTEGQVNSNEYNPREKKNYY